MALCTSYNSTRTWRITRGLLGLLPKFWHAKVLASQNFGHYLFGYRNLPTSHIYPTRMWASFLPNIWLAPKFWQQSKQALNSCFPKLQKLGKVQFNPTNENERKTEAEGEDLFKHFLYYYQIFEKCGCQLILNPTCRLKEGKSEAKEENLFKKNLWFPKLRQWNPHKCK